jgi:hypothetical protein
MRRWWVVGVVMVLAVSGCAHVRPAARWRLMHPPEVSDARAPRGAWVLMKAPIEEWHEVAVFDSEEECLAARQQNIDRAVDQAHAELGDDAKLALPLRRAVHARCVRGQ